MKKPFKFGDVSWRNVDSDLESMLLNKYKDEPVLVVTNICIRQDYAKNIQFENGEWRLTSAQEKAIKFAFIGTI